MAFNRLFQSPGVVEEDWRPWWVGMGQSVGLGATIAAPPQVARAPTVGVNQNIPGRRGGPMAPPSLGRPYTMEERRQQIEAEVAQRRAQGVGAWAEGAPPLRTIMYPPSPWLRGQTIEGPVTQRIPTGGGYMAPYGTVAPPVGPMAPTGPPAGGGGEIAGGPQFRDPIDPKIDKAWYHAFQREHDMKTPEEFYTGLPYDQLRYHRADAGWALDEALDDLEWSRGFERRTGTIPTDDDWKAWWMHNYGRDMRTDQERRRDKMALKGGGGKKLPRFRGKGQEEGQRPPLWVPPVTYWR